MCRYAAADITRIFSEAENAPFKRFQACRYFKLVKSEPLLYTPCDQGTVGAIQITHNSHVKEYNWTTFAIFLHSYTLLGHQLTKNKLCGRGLEELQTSKPIFLSSKCLTIRCTCFYSSHLIFSFILAIFTLHYLLATPAAVLCWVFAYSDPFYCILAAEDKNKQHFILISYRFLVLLLFDACWSSIVSYFLSPELVAISTS